MDIHLNSEPVKYAIVALSFPLWGPFAKAMWKEFNDALRDEGGLFGAPPTPEQLRAIERERGRFRSGMVSVTWAEHERQQGHSGAASNQSSATPTRNERAGFRSR